MPYRGMPGITKGFQVTGGPQTQSSALADGGTINDIYGTLRAKSSTQNKIPGAQMIIDAKQYEADQAAETMRFKGEQDAKAINAKFDYYESAKESAGESARNQGILSGLTGVGLGAVKLLSGGGSATDSLLSGDNPFSFDSSAIDWNDTSNVVNYWD